MDSIKFVVSEKMFFNSYFLRVKALLSNVLQWQPSWIFNTFKNTFYWWLKTKNNHANLLSKGLVVSEKENLKYFPKDSVKLYTAVVAILDLWSTNKLKTMKWRWCPSCISVCQKETPTERQPDTHTVMTKTHMVS